MTDTALRKDIDTPRPDADPPAIVDLAGELAWCLGRFVNATADEVTMQRAQEALTAWRAVSDRA